MSRPINVLSPDETERLLSTISDNRDFTPSPQRRLRNRLITLLMLDAGLRVGEVVALQIIDLWYAGAPAESVTVPARCAKNKKERIVPASTRLSQTILDVHFAIWDPSSSLPQSYAFSVGIHREPLTARQVQRIIRRSAFHAIGRIISPHTLRHTCATRWMHKTSMRVVQELLGHSNIQTTQIYTHVNHDDLKQAVKESEPDQ